MNNSRTGSSVHRFSTLRVNVCVLVNLCTSSVILKRHRISAASSSHSKVRESEFKIMILTHTSVKAEWRTEMIFLRIVFEGLIFSADVVFYVLESDLYACSVFCNHC